jgi:hypothetical protein
VAGDSFAERTDLCRQYSYHRCKNFSSVLLTPENNLSPGQKYPKSLKFIAGVNKTAEKLFNGVNDTADKFFGGVKDTSE